MVCSVWTPLREMNRLHNELGRAFARERDTQLAIQPRVDIAEEADRYVIKADLPGVPSEAIQVSVENNVLTISGERAAESTSSGDNILVQERRFGSFTRRFSLPKHIDAEHIGAEAKHGVLTVTLPKRAEVQPRSIKVEVKQ